MVPDSVGRNGGEMGAAADARGDAFVALVTDHKLWGGPNFGTNPGSNDVMFTTLRTETAADPQLAARPPEPPGALASEPREPEEIARLRNYQIQADGKNYKIYRGDLHRHTEISLDGAGDGTLWDAYRYAMDAAGLDFWWSPTINPDKTNTCGGGPRRRPTCSMSPAPSPPSTERSGVSITGTDIATCCLPNAVFRFWISGRRRDKQK
jgi:hypothetical protein